MIIFIINTIIVILSIALLAYDYLYIKNNDNNIELRIKRFIFGGIELLIIGTVLVFLSLVGSRLAEVDIAADTYLLVIFIVIALAIYICLLFLWNSFFSYLQKYFTKQAIPTKYRFKSISIYGLIYAFGIMFYLIYSFSVF